MNEIPLTHVLFVSTALFFIGMYGLFTRRKLITMLMAIELMLNSVNINFVAFNKYLYPEKLDGIFFTIFIITIAAAEAAVAIAIIINLYRSHNSIDVEDATTKNLVAKLDEMNVGRPLIVTENGSENLFLAARNIPYVQIRDVQGMDPASLVGARHVVMTADAVKKIEEWLS